MKKTINKTLFLILVASIVFTSCSEEDNGESSDNNQSKYVLGARVQVTDDDYAHYILGVDDLMTGTITSTGQGIEDETVWAYSYDNNNLFSFGDLCNVFTNSEEGLVNNRSFAYNASSVLAVIEEDDAIIALSGSWDIGGTGTIEIIDSKEGYVRNSISTPFYEPTDTVMANNVLFYPTSPFVENSKLFVPLILWLPNQGWAVPNVPESYVSVYSYPELEYIETITTDKGGSISTYSNQPAAFGDENGNYYLLATNTDNAILNPDLTSCVVQVDGNTAQFTDYYFDVEAASGYRPMQGIYVADGKAVVRCISVENSDAGTSAYSDAEENRKFKIAILDLVNKSLTIVADIPDHNAEYKTQFLLEDGKVYTRIKSNESHSIYRVDPETATAEKGATLDMYRLVGLFKAE